MTRSHRTVVVLGRYAFDAMRIRFTPADRRMLDSLADSGQVLIHEPPNPLDRLLGPWKPR